MKYKLIPKSDIQKLEKVRKELFEIIPVEHHNIIYTITHTKYAEIEGDL